MAAVNKAAHSSLLQDCNVDIRQLLYCKLYSCCFFGIDTPTRHHCHRDQYRYCKKKTKNKEHQELLYTFANMDTQCECSHRLWEVNWIDSYCCYNSELFLFLPHRTLPFPPHCRTHLLLVILLLRRAWQKPGTL